MTIYDKTQDEKILFPVGIGIIQTETVRNFYNTSDATATPSDIIVGKTAYSRYGMINGELDIQDRIETSYQEGFANGKVLGRDEIIEQQSDATITPDKVLKGFIGYGKNNERIVGENDEITTIDVGASGIKFGYSTFSQIPSYYNFDNVTSVQRMFYKCGALTTVPLFSTARCGSMNYMFYGCEALKTVPQFNTYNVTNMSYMFYDCEALTTVPLFNTNKVTDMSYMFAYCNSLESVPQFNTSNVTNMSYMFQYCSSLESVPQFNTSNVTNMSYMFNECRNLIDVPKLDTKNCDNFYNMFIWCNSLASVPEFDFSGYKGTSYQGSAIFGTSSNYPPNLTTIGGFKDIGKAYSGGASSYKDIPLQYLSKLTRESILNVFNKVYDMNLNTAQTGAVNIKLHANVKALLSDEDIAIATNKGWTVQ